MTQPESSNHSDQSARPPVHAAKSEKYRRWLLLSVLIAVLGLVVASLAWQRLGSIQDQLAQQSAQSTAVSAQANVTAKAAQDVALQTAAKLAMTDAKLAEVTLQRSQLEDLIQSLSRSRDETLLVDTESSIRLSVQQSQLSGSVEPLLAALKSAELRIAHAAQPRLAPVQRALARDIAKVKSATVADTPTLLVRMDELISLVDELAVTNAQHTARPADAAVHNTDEGASSWWMRQLALVGEELRGLVRVSTIESPEAALLSPDQAYFARENLKLRLLNARLGLLSRQSNSVHADLANAETNLTHYFDLNSRKTQTALTLLRQVQSQTKVLDLPRVDDTLAALTTAAAGR